MAMKLLERVTARLGAPVREAADVQIGERYRVDHHFFQNAPRQEAVRARLALHRGSQTVYVQDLLNDESHNPIAIVCGDPKDTTRSGLARIPARFLLPQDGEMKRVPEVTDAAGRPLYGRT